MNLIPKRQSSPRAVHLLAGLPTPNVLQAFDRIRAAIPVLSFAEFVEDSNQGWAQVGVLLPPHMETSLVVEGWESHDFLEQRFGVGTHIGNVLTSVDAELVADQLTSAEPISACGWGASARDARSVADIAVGQIESSTHLLLVGNKRSCEAIVPMLRALNPGAAALTLEDALATDLDEFVTGLRCVCPKDESAPSARIVPPWLDLLQAESAVPTAPDHFLYRRTLPFDAERFGEWLASPPRELVRGKGKVWLAQHCDQALGYSCAGSVHRVFASGSWWANCRNTMWPTCEVERRRLLGRWHPQFGDRRQEIVFVGVGLDPDLISSGLDACLVSEEEALDAIGPDHRPLPGDADVVSHNAIH